MPQGESRCRGCGRTITWAVTSNGKSIPLDPKPDPAGNVAMMLNVDMIPCAWVLKKDEEPKPGEKRYQSHFATCTARPAPKTKPINTKRDAASAAQRGRRFPAAPLPDVVPDNVRVLRFQNPETLF